MFLCAQIFSVCACEMIAVERGEGRQLLWLGTSASPFFVVLFISHLQRGTAGWEASAATGLLPTANVEVTVPPGLNPGGFGDAVME